MAISFTLTVTESDWKTDLGGWLCPAIAIPSAEVEAVFVNGERKDIGQLEVLQDHRTIRWIGKDPPKQATFSILIEKNLTTEELTLKWKKLAIALPIIATILVSFGVPITTNYIIDGDESPSAATLEVEQFKGDLERVTHELEIAKASLTRYEQQEKDYQEALSDAKVIRARGERLGSNDQRVHALKFEVRTNADEDKAGTGAAVRVLINNQAYLLETETGNPFDKGGHGMTKPVNIAYTLGDLRKASILIGHDDAPGKGGSWKVDSLRMLVMLEDSNDFKTYSTWNNIGWISVRAEGRKVTAYELQ